MQNHSITIGVDGDNGLTFADGRYLIRKVMAPLPGFDPEGLALPSGDGSEVFEFDRLGRHLRTRDGVTGAVIRTFEYDAAKQLIGVVDAFGNRTRVERDAAGKASAVVAPGGQRTGLAIGAAGWLEGVTNPASETAQLGYHGDAGLLASYRRPEGGTTRFDYDGQGRLIRHRGADGEERTLTRSELEDGTRVTIETAGGRKTSYSMEVLPNGDRRRTVREPSGAETASVVKTDGRTIVTAPDGTTTTVETGTDPRWDSRVPVAVDTLIETPGGKTLRTTREDRASLADPTDPFSATEIRSTFREGSETSTWTYAAGSATNLDDQTVTARTAEGRETVTTLDRHGRVTKQTAGTGVAPLEYAYDERGRLKSAKQGPQVTTFAYDARHRVLTRGDASGAQIRFGYDDADRVIERVLPGGKAYRYEYDDDGNVSNAHDAARQGAHVRLDRRRPAAVVRAARQPRLPARVFDRAPARERHAPERRAAGPSYDPSGRLTGEDHVQSRRTFTYDGGQDRFATSTRAGGRRRHADDRLRPRRPAALQPRLRRRGGRQVRVRLRRPAAADVREAHGRRRGALACARVRRRPPAGQVRPVHLRAQRPGRIAVSKITDGKASR